MTKTTPLWFVALTAAACGTGPAGVEPSLASATVAVPVRIATTAVPLNPEDLAQTAIGGFSYAGGIEITSTGLPAVHELSDVEIHSDGRLVAVSDGGYLFTARLVLDETDRLTGITGAAVTALADEGGRPVRGVASDAEGLTTLSNGDRLVSFERTHRIWLYPAAGGTPRPVPKPDAEFPENAGMEALTAYAAAGPTAYLVGGEGGDVWLCSVSSSCRPTTLGRMVPPGFGLTGLAAYGNEGDLAMLARVYDPQQGNRISVKLIADAATDRPRLLDELTMAAPLTRDNFEALAIVPRPAGGIRVYLLSDDNGSQTQHTYLLAFDRTAP